MDELDIARWYVHLAETSNKSFMPLFFDEHRFLVLKGGGGSGKSVFAARKLIERAFAEPGHRFLVCRKVAKTLRESCWRNILDQLSEYYPGRYSPNKSDLNQLNIRLRGKHEHYDQIILTFNPISIMHWLKLRFFDRKDPKARTHESTYKDNRFLEEKDRQVLEDFRNTDRYYYEVYCLGMWGTTGRTVFNGEAVTRRLLENVQSKRVGMMEYDYDGLTITNVRFVDDPQGYIQIFEEPVEGVPYVIGGDTAGDGSDQFVDQVLDNRTGQQVAILRQGFDEDLYAHQTYALGVWYNTALIGIETNFSTYPVKELERLGYPKQYVRERVDTYTGNTVEAYGFETNTKTRPIIIAGFIRAARDDINLVCDQFTLQEMLTFVRSESWKPEAEEGAHDDGIMALAIAHYIRPQQDYLSKTEEEKKVWTDAMWEDYENASERERKEMLRDWGKPTRR